ncbi:MAG TPA: PQQ-dependent sugar dehydrogenase [Methylomirabilota bacterium]|nr:PQQ-dependent sugar dehydrogenase [Methylomirabilota bacterium]
MALAALALGAVLAGAGRASESPPPLVLPAGFTADVFATGLGRPRALIVDPAGTLIVSIPSQGKIVALADPGPGRSATAETVVDGLHLPHGLAFRQGALYVAETGRVLRFRYDARTRRARDPVVVVAGLPAGEHHWARGIAFGRGGDLLVSVGSSCDVCREPDRRRASIARYAADGSDERLFATGLRNPLGLAVHPRTGVLWTTVNERDWRRGGAPPDYITEVHEGDAFGWPDCYAERGRFVPDPELPEPRACQGLTRPTFEIPAHSAPLGLAFYSGAAFPAPYRESLFVALHGSRPELPPAGYKVVRVVFRGDRPAGIEDFATGWRRDDRVWGRPVDVVTGRDGALYVSDDHGGRIVRIAFRPR